MSKRIFAKGVNRYGKSRRGMTLIEIVIAIAILGIITAVFLSSFTTGYINIFNMGKKTKAMYQAQTMLDRISDSAMTAEETIQALYPDAQEYGVPGDTDSSVKTWYHVENRTIDGQALEVVSLLIYYGEESYTTLTAMVP